MIIKSAVRSLRQHPSPDVAEAAASIDEEVARLNRVVTDVLDFAKPIRFELRTGRSRWSSAATPPRPRQLAADDVPVVAVEILSGPHRSSPTPNGCAPCW